MKTINIKLLIMAITVIMMACNSPSNRAKDTTKTDDNYATTNDSINNNTMAVDGDNDANRDQEFIKEAASGGLMEVELGKYAQQNAMSPRVRNFASMMVKDHSKANEELMSIAARKNITVPTTMEDKHREMMSDIQKKTGMDFDKAYMKEMVDDHEKDVDRFKKHAENGVDPDLKTFASQTLSVLLMHQDSAKNIREALDRNKNNSMSNK